MRWVALALARGLWPSLRGLLLRVGRWVLRRISRVGYKRILHYMEERIERFRKRAITRKAKWARAFNADRAERWARVVEWIKANRVRLRKRVATELNGLAKEYIPTHVPCETLAGWCAEQGVAI